MIAAPDGAIWLSVAGNAGMARGGSGDLLAGVIGSLLVQARDRLRDGSLSVAAVAAAGVYLHGAAGDRCAAVRGEYGMLPSGHSARALRRNARVVGQQNGAGEHIRAPLIDSAESEQGSEPCARRGACPFYRRAAFLSRYPRVTCRPRLPETAGKADTAGRKALVVRTATPPEQPEAVSPAYSPKPPLTSEAISCIISRVFAILVARRSRAGEDMPWI